MMIDFLFDDETNTIDESVIKLVKDLLTFAAQAESLKGQYEVSITFVNDQRIQEINAQYRGKDTPTDVISFALEELSEGEVEIISVEGMPTVLGDIIISIDTAKKQASAYGHDEKREIGFLALHGFLHLLGYDHQTESEEKEMFGRQKKILAAFGLER